MKTTGSLSFILIILLLITPETSFSQVWVDQKPVPPKTGLKIPPRTEEGLVLLPGRWIWHRQSRMYMWLSPVWVEPPEGKSYAPGYWKTVKKGWVWVPGKWVKKRRFWTRFNE